MFHPLPCLLQAVAKGAPFLSSSCASRADRAVPALPGPAHMRHHRGSTGATPATSVPPQPLGRGSPHSGLHLAPGPRAWGGGWYTSRPMLSNNGRHSLARLSHPRHCPGSTGKLTSDLPRNKPYVLVLQLQPEVQTRSGFTPRDRNLFDLHRGTRAAE